MKHMIDLPNLWFKHMIYLPQKASVFCCSSSSFLLILSYLFALLVLVLPFFLPFFPSFSSFFVWIFFCFFGGGEEVFCCCCLAVLLLLSCCCCFCFCCCCCWLFLLCFCWFCCRSCGVSLFFCLLEFGVPWLLFLLSLLVFVLVVGVVVDVCCLVDLYLSFGQHRPKKEQPQKQWNPLFYSPILKGSSGAAKRPDSNSNWLSRVWNSDQNCA